MKISTLKKSKNKLVLLFENTDSTYINTLRRLIMAEVPTMAIETVEFRQNDSILYDEMLALRLGLIPLKTDLNSYDLASECDCEGAGCAKCQLKLTMKVEGPKTVLIEELNSQDSKVVPVYPETPLVKLLEHQKLEFEATAILGRGKEHMKWSPGLATFRGVPIIIAKSSANKDVINSNSKILSISGTKVNILDYTKYTIALEQDLEENGFEVNYSETEFIFTLESWGQLKPQEILERAIIEYNKILTFSKKS